MRKQQGSTDKDEFSSFTITKEGQLTVTSSWGTLFTNVYSPTFFMDQLDHYIKQLEYLLKNNRSSNPEYTRRDIRGYIEVKGTEDTSVIRKFLELKHSSRKDGQKLFADNLDLVKHMKKEGMWVTK